MKTTKKMRKKAMGMNYATKMAFDVGYKKPNLFHKGTTYVNPDNFL